MSPEMQIIHDLLKEMRGDIKSLDTKVEAITTEQVRQNAVVQTHEQRSTNLEKIVKPLVALDALYKAIVIFGGLAGAIYAVLKLFGH